ncbi:hypothetical protein DESC_600078 [Desulfosarcina cetonica]|nr:hypothetical protein DESC_600078 [Desulfosarcina cetonica]
MMISAGPAPSPREGRKMPGGWFGLLGHVDTHRGQVGCRAVIVVDGVGKGIGPPESVFRGKGDGTVTVAGHTAAAGGDGVGQYHAGRVDGSIGIGVIGDHVDDNGGVARCCGVVVDGHRRNVGRRGHHRDRDRGRQAVEHAVIGDVIETDAVAGSKGRCVEAERPVGVKGEPCGRNAINGRGQRIAVNVAVVAQHTRRGHGQDRTGHGVVIVGHRHGCVVLPVDGDGHGRHVTVRSAVVGHVGELVDAVEIRVGAIGKRAVGRQ